MHIIRKYLNEDSSIVELLDNNDNLDILIDNNSNLLYGVFEYLVNVLSSNNLNNIIEVFNDFVDYLVNNNVYLDFNLYNSKFSLEENNIAILILLSKLVKDFNSISNNKNVLDVTKVLKAYFYSELGRLAYDDRILNKINNSGYAYFKDLQESFELEDNIIERYDKEYYHIYGYLLAKIYDENNLEAILYKFENEKDNNGVLGVVIDELNDKIIKNSARIIKAVELYSYILFKDNIYEIVDRLNRLVACGILNAFIVNLLMESIPVFKENDKVLLSDGTVGIVHERNNNDMLYPIVVDLNGNYIDLRNNKNLFIVKIVK